MWLRSYIKQTFLLCFFALLNNSDTQLLCIDQDYSKMMLIHKKFQEPLVFSTTSHNIFVIFGHFFSLFVFSHIFVGHNIIDMLSFDEIYDFLMPKINLYIDLLNINVFQVKDQYFISLLSQCKKIILFIPTYYPLSLFYLLEHHYITTF